MPAYMPSVTINGQSIGADYSDSQPAVLTRVEHQWGRTSLYDPTEPGRLAIDVLDPSGEFIGSPALYQAPITMSLPGIGVTFNGTIDQVEIRPANWAHPQTGQRLTGWRARITAIDLIGALAKITTPGVPYTVADTNAFHESQIGPGYWKTNSWAVDINTRIAGAGIDVTVTGPGGTGSNLWWRPAIAGGDDLYTMIVRLYARDNFPSAATYNPRTKTITPIEPATPDGVKLTYVASVINTAPVSASSRSIPADTIRIDEDAAVESALSHNISSVRVYEFSDQTGTVEFDPPGATGAGWWGVIPTAQAVDYPIAGAQGFNQFDTRADIYYRAGQTDETPAQYVAKIVPIIQALNGRLYPPPLTFDLERFTYPVEAVTELMSAVLTRTPWTFPGARYEELVGFGPFFQLIGAIAVYDEGWEVQTVFAPARDTGSAGTFPINMLVTTATPTFNQYASYITLATLGTVTEGI